VDLTVNSSNFAVLAHYSHFKMYGYLAIDALHIFASMYAHCM